MGGLESVLARIKPGRKAEAREREFASRVLGALSDRLKPAKVVLAGSFAKGTFLEGDKDIDVFVLFGHSMKKEAMESIVRAAVEDAFGAAELKPGKKQSGRALYQLAYAQHPYVRVFLEGRKIDVVPAYEIMPRERFELRSAVDRSQLHTEYILSRMSSRQKDEVRLLKKFLKANSLYGAEIRVQGFSGYLCELLILKYGSFMKTIESAAGWKERTFLDAESRIAHDLGLQKFASPLVVIDPVDAERNVSAVVSTENYFAFINLARAFVKSKNKLKFFERRKMPAARLSKFVRARHLYCLEFAAPCVVDDVLWGQVRRLHSQIHSLLKKEGFEPLGYEIEKSGANIHLLLEILNEPLPERKLMLGPPLQFEKDCEKFSARYPDSFVFGGRMAAKIKRKERTLGQFLPKIRKLQLPSHLSSARRAKLYKGADAIRNCRQILENYARKFSFQKPG